MPTARILIADTPTALDRLLPVLVGYDLSIAYTLKEALDLLQTNKFDLVLCGIHFDDSRALNFVNQVRTTMPHEHMPIVMIRALPSDRKQLLQQSVSVVQSTLSISRYIECEEFDAEPEPDLAIRREIEKLLPSPLRL